MERTSKVAEIYQKFNYEWADPRTNDFILVSSPFKLLAITALYLWFCLKAGPHFMKDRKPYKLKNILIIYNLLQVAISTYFFIVSSKYWIFKYSFKCEPVDYSHNADALYMASAIHVYFLTKILELLDTVFFVLRKKYSQISILHLYHHTSMIFLTWMVAKYFAGGQGSLVGLINSFVHIFMYFYYFLASLGPKYQKYLTWKKQLTLLQLAQFAIDFIHSIQALPRKCDYPKPLVWLTLFQSVVLLYMFSSFYVKSYCKPKDVKEINETIKNGNKLKNEKTS